MNKSRIILLNMIFAFSIHNASANDELQYKADWQLCKESSECMVAREGVNYTCVNQAHEREARDFIRNIDSNGKEQCEVDHMRLVSSPVCIQGKCVCEDIGNSGGPAESCVRDDECVLFKVREWVSANKNTFTYWPYGGAKCTEVYLYPAPLAVCLQGKCDVSFR